MIRFGLHEEGGLTHITTTADPALLRQLDESAPKFGERLADGLRMNSIVLMPTDSDQKLLFDFAAAARKRKPERLLVAMRSAAWVLAELVNAPTEEPDPMMTVGMATAPYPGTHPPRWGMFADVAWPTEPVSDAEMTTIGTRHMRQFARGIRLDESLTIGSRLWNSSIYTHVNREQGVSVQTNPMGSCAIETDGMEFDAAEPRYHLYAHNLYSNQQQFVCLAGTIALAHAEELA